MLVVSLIAVTLAAACGPADAFSTTKSMGVGSTFMPPVLRSSGSEGRHAAPVVGVSMSGSFKEKWQTMDKTWSNRGGLILTQHRPNVWAAERPFLWNNIDVGCKMTLVKLSDGNLWVHSPVELDAEMRSALGDIGGEVTHIVSPNYEHMKFAKQWFDAFPDAAACGCPGIKEKYPGVGYQTEVPAPDGSLPAGWPREIEAFFFDCEKNPFTGRPFFNEVNFVHTPSKTLIATDTFWNYPKREVPRGTRAWKFGMDQVYGPFYRSFMADPEELGRIVDDILSKDFTSILPAHGSAIGGSDDTELSMFDDQGIVFGGDAKQVLRSHFARGPSE
eukprot:CAMPEP_0173467078 /NCGR_PEP_ID=MMETSP1357-20121228/74437_1 /TAXON_ID=77926 /ORGANISM="Hemiselmis rufescens, Strain PCC563" /LENGTH=330 /DNA_ID=CAMNT_0014435185 /DNA_START=33 /DNA_END=1025 /DNA_ORIENTATION=+